MRWSGLQPLIMQNNSKHRNSPASPCFSQADIDEFLARKPKKYKMTERDYKELGRNIFLGVGDLIMSSAKISLYAAAHIPVSERQKMMTKFFITQLTVMDGDTLGPRMGKNIN